MSMIFIIATSVEVDKISMFFSYAINVISIVVMFIAIANLMELFLKEIGTVSIVRKEEEPPDREIIEVGDHMLVWGL